MLRIHTTKEAGQTLIEVLAALSVASVIITAASIAVVVALQNAQQARSQDIGEQYTQDGMEQIRQLRDSDWTTFDNYGASSPGYVYCFNQDNTLSKPNDPADTTCDNKKTCMANITASGVSFKREVCFEKNASSCEPSAPVGVTPTPANATKVTVSTYWRDSKCTDDSYCHESQQATCLTDVHRVPTP